MSKPHRWTYRFHRCEVYFRDGLADYPDGAWVGWARRYPDRTTDYCRTPGEAQARTHLLVDATLAELRGDDYHVRWGPDPGPQTPFLTAD